MSVIPLPIKEGFLQAINNAPGNIEGLKLKEFLELQTGVKFVTNRKPQDKCANVAETPARDTLDFVTYQIPMKAYIFLLQWIFDYYTSDAAAWMMGVVESGRFFKEELRYKAGAFWTNLDQPANFQIRANLASAFAVGYHNKIPDTGGVPTKFLIDLGVAGAGLQITVKAYNESDFTLAGSDQQTTDIEGKSTHSFDIGSLNSGWVTPCCGSIFSKSDYPTILNADIRLEEMVNADAYVFIGDAATVGARLETLASVKSGYYTAE